MPHPDRYRLVVARSTSKAARRLDEARKRLVELEAGAESRFTDDTVEALTVEVDGLTQALADVGIVVCEDCHEPLTTKISRSRGIGPKCWAKRQRAARAAADLAVGGP